jgi:hypothetical protein
LGLLLTSLAIVEAVVQLTAAIVKIRQKLANFLDFMYMILIFKISPKT